MAIFFPQIRKVVTTTSTILVLAFTPVALHSDEPVIPILLSSDSDIYLEGLGGIQSEVKFKTKVSYLNVLVTGTDGIESYFQSIKKDKPPLVIAVGFKAAKTARAHLKNTPILFSMVNLPRSLGLERGGICGFSLNISATAYFETLREFSGNIKNVVGFYSAEQSRRLAEEGSYLDLRYNLFYRAIRVKKGSDLTNKLNNLKGVDAIYMVPDVIYNQKNFTTLSSYAKKNKIILMSPFKDLVRKGATFGIIPNYTRIGSRTGILANQILAGETNCNQSGVRFPEQLTFYLNEKFAGKSGIKIPQSVKDKALRTRILQLGLSLYNSKKYKKSKTVFSDLLAKNPGNKDATFYLALIEDKLTGGKTKELFKSALEQRLAGNYPAAIKTYRSILVINPGSFKAKTELEKTLTAYSSLFFKAGAKAEAEKKPFVAIRSYLRAVRIDSKNQKATFRLNKLRQKQAGRIPTIFKTGLMEYNRRNYPNAITAFRNIGLIQPDNKRAAEYLRLSLKKQSAISRLKAGQ